MIKKNYWLDEADIAIVNNVKTDLGLSSDSEAVRYLIRQSQKDYRSGNGIQMKILRQIEERVDLLLDIANTELIERNADQVYPVRMAESPVLSNARKLRRQMLADKKQRSDYGKKKK